MNQDDKDNQTAKKKKKSNISYKTSLDLSNMISRSDYLAFKSFTIVVSKDGFQCTLFPQSNEKSPSRSLKLLSLIKANWDFLSSFQVYNRYVWFLSITNICWKSRFVWVLSITNICSKSRFAWVLSITNVCWKSRFVWVLSITNVCWKSRFVQNGGSQRCFRGTVKELIQVLLCHFEPDSDTYDKQNQVFTCTFTFYFLQLYCPNGISPMGNSGGFSQGKPASCDRVALPKLWYMLSVLVFP